MTLLLAAVLALVPSGQATQLRIDAIERAAPLPRVLESISQKSGIPLTASPEFAQEVVLVHAEGAPLSALLERIASATAGRWLVEGDGRKLVPDTAARNRESQQAYERRLQSVRRAIADRVNAMNEKPMSENDEGFRLPVGPDERAITRLLSGIDPAPLAQMQAGQRVVYATAPTRAQRPLGQGAVAVVQAFVEEHNRTMPDDPLKDLDGAMAALIPLEMRNMIAARMRKIVNPAKALLIASRPRIGMFGDSDQTQLELRIFDGEGTAAFTHTTLLSAESLGEIFAPPNEQTPRQTTPVEYSANSKLVLETGQNIQQVATTGRVSPELVKLMSRPDEIDPLSLMPTDELFSLAKLKKQPIVASVPDSAISMAAFMQGTSRTVEQVEAALRNGSTMRLAEEDGWLIVRPNSPVSDRLNRTNREALATLISAAQSKGLASLDDIAAFSLHAPSPLTSGLLQLYGMAVVPGLAGDMSMIQQNWDTVRLYGTLLPAQRQTLSGGGGILFSQLTPPQQALLRRIAYSGETPISAQIPEQSDFFSRMVGMFGMGEGAGVRSEPTEVMPIDVPRDAVLTIQTDQQTIAVPADGMGPSGSLTMMGADELALFRMFRNDPNMAGEVGGFLPNFTQFRLGERKVLHIGLRVAPDAVLNDTLMDNRIPQNARVVAADNLPPEFEALIAARLEALKKSPLGMIGGLMGGLGRRQPPPP
jgi:hypothetical protein